MIARLEESGSIWLQNIENNRKMWALRAEEDQKVTAIQEEWWVILIWVIMYESLFLSHSWWSHSAQLFHITSTFQFHWRPPQKLRVWRCRINKKSWTFSSLCYQQLFQELARMSKFLKKWLKTAQKFDIKGVKFVWIFSLQVSVSDLFAVSLNSWKWRILVLSLFPFKIMIISFQK